MELLLSAHPAAASDWVRRFAHLMAPGSTVLDLACGSGRHVRWLTRRGCRVTAVDRDAPAVGPLCEVAEVIVADLEDGPWPLSGRCFDTVVVTHYLWRPRLAELLDCVAPGGLLLYETFGAEQGRVGRPSRPDFLLRPGELLGLVPPPWRVLAYEDGWLEAPLRHVQRIAARRGPGSAADMSPAARLTAPADAPPDS